MIALRHFGPMPMPHSCPKQVCDGGCPYFAVVYLCVVRWSSFVVAMLVVWCAWWLAVCCGVLWWAA
eukprot:13394429-Alexandrium_andersonii.AAC.1